MPPADKPAQYEQPPAQLLSAEQMIYRQEITVDGHKVIIDSSELLQTGTITVSISGKSCLVNNPEDEQAIAEDPTCVPIAKPLPGKIAIQIINEDTGATTLTPIFLDINQQDGTWYFNEKVPGSPGKYSINIKPVDVEEGLICSVTTVTYIVDEDGEIKLENPTTQTACFIDPETRQKIYLPLISQN